LSGRHEYLRGPHQASREAVSEVAPLSGTDLSKPVVVGIAEDALVAFGIAAILHGVADPAVELQKTFAEVIGEYYPGKPIVHKWCGVDAPLAPLDKTVTEAITWMRSIELVLTQIRGSFGGSANLLQLANPRSTECLDSAEYPSPNAITRLFGLTSGRRRRHRRALVAPTLASCCC
jgi:hypothetical protein